jgi:hypothetical protein
MNSPTQYQKHVHRDGMFFVGYIITLHPSKTLSLQVFLHEHELVMYQAQTLRGWFSF